MYLDSLRSQGTTPLFGGSGEGTGLGGGFGLVAGPAERGQFRLFLSATTRMYQEFDLSWAQPWGRNKLFLEGSHQ